MRATQDAHAAQAGYPVQDAHATPAEHPVQDAYSVQDARAEAELPPSGEIEEKVGHTDTIEGPTEHLDMSVILPTRE